MMKACDEDPSTLSLEEFEAESYRQKMRQDLLKLWWCMHEVLLVCLCDEASGSSALLAVRKDPVSVRFYEVGVLGCEA